MTDTPRTNEAEANTIACGIPISMVCRQIERELNEERKSTLTLREINRGITHDMVTLAEKLIEATKERDEARECMREIINGYKRTTYLTGYDGEKVVGDDVWATKSVTGNTYRRWRKAARMEEQ